MQCEEEAAPQAEARRFGYGNAEEDGIRTAEVAGEAEGEGTAAGSREDHGRKQCGECFCNGYGSIKAPLEWRHPRHRRKRLRSQWAEYWLADGFHRYHAHRMSKFGHVSCEVRKGTLNDAIEFACAANQTHGLKRTREDIQNAIRAMLKLKPTMTDNEVARHIGCSHSTVSAHRPASCQVGKIATRNGKEYEINTSNIGRKPQAETTTEKTVEYVDTDTGEVLDNVEAVTTTESAKREIPPTPATGIDDQHGRRASWSA